MSLQFSYKQTEIGRIPKEWEVERLGNISNQRNEIVQPEQKRNDKFVGLEHLEKGETKIKAYGLASGVISSKFRFVPGDILYGKLRPYLDKAAIADFAGICSTDLVVIDQDKKKVYPNFLIYIIHSPNFISHAISTTSGTNHPRTSWNAIAKFKLGLPPLPEQKQIAEILSTVDQAIEKIDEAIKKTQRLKNGLMQELLTKGIGHREFKETEIGKIPKEWEVRKLGEVITLCQYGLSSKMSQAGEYPIIKMDDIVNGNVVPDKVKYINLDKKTFENFRLEKGDILFNRTNSYELVGRTGIFLLDGEYVFASYLIRLRPKGEVADSFFLTSYLIFSNETLRRLATRAVHQANINATTLQRVMVLIPPLPEQQKIAEILGAVDGRLELLRKRKERLERIKKGLMNDLLTGRMRVKIS